VAVRNVSKYCIVLLQKKINKLQKKKVLVSMRLYPTMAALNPSFFPSQTTESKRKADIK